MRKIATGLVSAAVISSSLVAAGSATAAPTVSADRQAGVAAAPAARTAPLPGAAQPAELPGYEAAKAAAQRASAARAASAPAQTAQDRARRPCSYPVTQPRLSIFPTYRNLPRAMTVRFRGTLVKNRCPIPGARILLTRARTGQVVASGVTDRSGRYAIRYRVTRSTTFFAWFRGTRTYDPAVSQVSRIVVRARR